jgi:hypothetical protein
MMARIIGYFLDRTEAGLDGAKGLSAKDVRNRIFAISSVSDGSMGAVMVTAALNAGLPDSENPPCAKGPVTQWWGMEVNNGRDRFEALTSGDILTADFFGFAFNDMLPFAWRDRAAVLEDSWRNRFREVVLAGTKHTEASCQGLDCPFLSLRPRSGHWIPLLVLNGTSEATGSRHSDDVIGDDVHAADQMSAARPVDCPVFVGADAFHQLLRTKMMAGPSVSLIPAHSSPFGDVGFAKVPIRTGATMRQTQKFGTLCMLKHLTWALPLRTLPNALKSATALITSAHERMQIVSRQYVTQLLLQRDR